MSMRREMPVHFTSLYINDSISGFFALFWGENKYTLEK